VESFRDHWGFVDRPLEIEMEAWRKFRLEDPLFDPALYFLALDGEQIAGVSLCKRQADNDPQEGYVHTLAVRRPWRKRGLGKALLLHSFREFQARGLLRASLVVDGASLTGAVRLYESVGMRSDPKKCCARGRRCARWAKKWLNKHLETGEEKYVAFK
jgi:ribosomal protein S18 acetylase RimI-like enzyme